jgi:energy-coupling factor transporter ATP-binding protein EcfA2
MIEAQGLTKRYGDKVAVDDLSFTVRPGRVTGFLGPNGAGKTTTMRMILGLDRPAAGSVTVNGKPYAELYSAMREVGALLDAKAVHGGPHPMASMTQRVTRKNRVLRGLPDRPPCRGGRSRRGPGVVAVERNGHLGGALGHRCSSRGGGPGGRRYPSVGASRRPSTRNRENFCLSAR